MFVAAGESLVDLVAEPRSPGQTLRLQAHPGGSPYNCAVALARLGADTGFMCPFSSDGFGDHLIAPLESNGVARLIAERVEAPTTLAIVTLDARGHAQYQFYRDGTADRAFDRDTLLTALPEAVTVFQIGGFCAIEPDDAAAWMAVAEEAARRGATLSMDPNLRPSLVGDFEAYKSRLEGFFDIVHVLKLSEEDLHLLEPDMGVEDHARVLLDRPNCALVVVTLGEGGSCAFTRDASAAAERWTPREFGDTVGAGDSMMAGVLVALSDREALSPAALARLGTGDLGEVLRFGAVTAGLNCAHFGCHPPSRAEVEAILHT